MRRKNAVALMSLRLGFALSFASPAFAQNTSATGDISGRILNPVTREYVSKAEVRVLGTDLLAISEPDGFYRLTGVPAGTATLTVTYTGSKTEQVSVAITAGQVSTRDIELTSATHARSGETSLSGRPPTFPNRMWLGAQFRERPDIIAAGVPAGCSSTSQTSPGRRPD